jgi:hypothetical protein
MGRIDKDLLDLLVCPLTHAPLVEAGDWLYSTDSATRRKYPIRDGLPIMLVEESAVAEPDEFERIMAGAGRIAETDPNRAFSQETT